MTCTYVARVYTQLAKTACLIGVFALAGCAASHAIDAAIVRAWERSESMPLATRIDETLTIERAYSIQKKVVQSMLGDRTPVGFKAGFTSSAAQSRFGADEPVAGVLLTAAHQTPPVLQLSALRGLHLETEVAMRVGKRIDSRLTSTATLIAHIDGIAPAIELPNLDYADPQHLSALDIIATNVAAAYFRTGTFLSPRERDPNDVTVRLTCDGEEVNVGSGRDAMGDQWQAALWLVNTIIDMGWTIEPGQVLLTGALGNMVKARAAHCVASFANWGELSVTIEP